MTPTVSCILPTHNRSGLVQRALKSIAEQTWDNLEIIIVDDGSSDSTPDILKTAMTNDPRIRLIRHDAAQGPMKARNSGIQAATGTLIAFLDDDDQWMPEKLEKQIPALSDFSMACCLTEILVKKTSITTTYSGPTEFSFEDLLHSTNYFYPSGILSHTDKVQSINGFDPAFPEREFLLRMAKHHGPATLVPEALVLFDRRHELGRVSQTPFDINGQLAILEKYHDAMTPESLDYQYSNYYFKRWQHDKGFRNRYSFLLKSLSHNPKLIINALKYTIRKRFPK